MLPTSCVAVDPHNPLKILVGTGDWDGWGGYSQGIEISEDGGASWANVGNGQFGNCAVRRILVDPENGQIVTAVTSRGAVGNGQVWRSSDGGRTWTAAITVPAMWCDIVCSAADNSGNRTYYAVAGGTHSQIWRSSDRGASWTKIASPMRTGVSTYDTADLAASPTNPATVYLVGTGDQKVWKSTNSGSSWMSITDGTLANTDWTQSWYDFSLTCSTNGTSDVLYLGLIDLLQSSNGGSSWHSFMNGFTGSDLAHVNLHDVLVDPTNPNHLLACNDGGIYDVAVSGPGGSFTSLNGNLGVTQFYSADFHPTDPTRIIGGSQDIGSPAALGNLQAWRSVTGGNGTAALMNPLTPNLQYSTYQFFGGPPNIGFNRTTNAWNSATYVSTNAGSDQLALAGPMVMAATDPGVLYLGTSYLWQYSESTGSWTARLGNQKLAASGTVTSIGVTKASPLVLYAGAYDGELWMSRDEGGSWTQIDSGAVSLPNRSLTAISVRDDNANDMLVGLSGTGADHLWRCADTTSGARTWIDASGSGQTALPDVPVNAIARDPADPIRTWYAGTDLGVFKTQDAGATWLDVTRPLGLPNVQVNGLSVRGEYLYAVTFGRGIWRLHIGASGGGNPTLAGLSLSPSTVVGPNPSLGTVILTSPAPAGGLTVSLLSGNPTVAGVPPNVTVAAGSSTATFSVATTVVATPTPVTIEADLNSSVATGVLTVNPDGVTDVNLSPRRVTGGASVHGTVRISFTSNGSTTVQLASSNPGVAQVPASVTIPSGQNEATFTATTTPTPDDANVTITATLGSSSAQSDLVVEAPVIASLTLAQQSIVGGNPVQATVVLSGQAPSVGAPIDLSTNNSAIATVPAQVTVEAGQTTASFTVTTEPVAVDSGVTIRAGYRGVVKSANLTVTAQKIASVTVSPNPAVGGNTLTGRVNLAGPTAGSRTVQLSCDSSFASVPATVTIPNLATYATFSVSTRPVNVATVVTIYAVSGGSVGEGVLTLQPLALKAFTLSANTAYERSTVTGTIGLNGPALQGGAVVQVTSSNPQVASVPATVTFSQGQSVKTFPVTTGSISSPQQVAITVSRGTVSLRQTLMVYPVVLDSLRLDQASVLGGITVHGVVTLAAPAPQGGYIVNLTSSSPDAASVPATVTITQGGRSATFNVVTHPVSQTSFVSIQATHGPSTVAAQLQVLPPEVGSFTLSTYSTRGGSSLNGTVTLTGRAPTGGLLVHIDANPALAWPSADVIVPAGSNSKNFSIQTASVGAVTQVTLSAYTFSVYKSVVLALTP